MFIKPIVLCINNNDNNNAFYYKNDKHAFPCSYQYRIISDSNRENPFNQGKCSFITLQTTSRADKETALIVWMQKPSYYCVALSELVIKELLILYALRHSVTPEGLSVTQIQTPDSICLQRLGRTQLNFAFESLFILNRTCQNVHLVVYFIIFRLVIYNKV